MVRWAYLQYQLPATLLETNELSGNERFFSIDFLDQIDVAILSNPTDQNRLQRVKQELKSMNKSYTQIEVEDWFVYGTHDWLVNHYKKVLLPWQTDYNVEYGQYYELLGTPNEQNADFTLTETLIDHMEDGGTSKSILAHTEVIMTKPTKTNRTNFRMGWTS